MIYAAGNNTFIQSTKLAIDRNLLPNLPNVSKGKKNHLLNYQSFKESLLYVLHTPYKEIHL